MSVSPVGDSLQKTGGAGNGGRDEESGQAFHQRGARTGPREMQTGVWSFYLNSHFNYVKILFNIYDDFLTSYVFFCRFT